MKSIDRNVLQSDIKGAIEAASKYKSVERADDKAAFFSGYLRRRYPEIAALLRYIAGIDSTPV